MAQLNVGKRRASKGVVAIGILAQYSLQILRSAFFSGEKGENRCLIATSGGEMSIDLACVSMSKPYLRSNDHTGWSGAAERHSLDKQVEQWK